MRDHQSALRMTCHRRQVVKQVVRMRQNDRANPTLSIVVRGIINPNRAERCVKRSLAGAGKEPDSSIAIADDTSEVVIRIGWTGFSLLSRTPRGHFRLGTIH